MSYTLISHSLCPYVQRAAIVLAEKHLPFDRLYIDLANKPEWFLKTSPLGKVPLLRVGNTHLFESSAIVEYLEDVCPEPLRSPDAVERARERAYVEVASQVLSGIGRLYNAHDEMAFEQALSDLRSLFVHLDAKLTSPSPYFAGDRFGLVDAAFGPVFRYFDVFDKIEDFGTLAGLPRVQDWRDALSRRPSVRDAVTSDYADLLLKFLLDRRSWISRKIAVPA